MMTPYTPPPPFSPVLSCFLILTTVSWWMCASVSVPINRTEHGWRCPSKRAQIPPVSPTQTEFKQTTREVGVYVEGGEDKQRGEGLKTMLTKELKTEHWWFYNPYVTARQPSDFFLTQRGQKLGISTTEVWRNRDVTVQLWILLLHWIQHCYKAECLYLWSW